MTEPEKERPAELVDFFLDFNFWSSLIEFLKGQKNINRFGHNVERFELKRFSMQKIQSRGRDKIAWLA